MMEQLEALSCGIVLVHEVEQRISALAQLVVEETVMV